MLMDGLEADAELVGFCKRLRGLTSIFNQPRRPAKHRSERSLCPKRGVWLPLLRAFGI